MKKIFSCGHVGKGKYCHRCEQKQKRMALRVAERVIKQEQILASEAVLGISCDSVPVQVIHKAAEIVESLKAGTCFSLHKGKRLLYKNRNVISIPVGYSHRLLCEIEPMKPLRLLSHEDYNRIWKTV